MDWREDPVNWHSFRQRIRWQILAIVLLAALTAVLGACGSSSSRNVRHPDESNANIAYEELPDSIGQGFPLVDVDDEQAQIASVTPGVAAPDFDLVLDDGSYLRLSDLQGRPVLINFWATWCPPCRAEMPDIVRIAGQEDELVVIAANVQESMDAIQPFAEEFEMAVTVARDADGDLRDLYQVRGMPTSVFIDRTGEIALVWSGALTGDKLQQYIDGIH